MFMKLNLASKSPRQIKKKKLEKKKTILTRLILEMEHVVVVVVEVVPVAFISKPAQFRMTINAQTEYDCDNLLAVEQKLSVQNSL